ncbi:hypothetical protein CPC16_003371, partial [Podila verticillata]
TASNNLGSPDPGPLVQHRIMEGLNATLARSSTIECCCRSLQDLAPDLNPAPVEKGSLAESQHLFFGRVLSDSLEVLAKEAFSTEEAKAMDLTDVSKKLYNIVRLLVVISKLEVMKNSTQTIFEVEPLMASTLWECIQEIMDRFTTMQHDPDPGALDSHEPPYGFGLKFLVAGMQLILVDYMRLGTAMTWFGLDDLALMSYYAIELCKRTRSREVSQSAEYAMSARLLLSVLGQVAHKVKDYAENRSGDGTDRELWDQVGVLGECMLNVVRQDLIVTDESRVVWKTLSVLRVIMNDLFTLVSQALTANNAVHPTRSREVPLDLFLWVRSKFIHPNNRVFLDGLVHRWIEEAMRLKKVEEEKTLLHPLLLRSGWRQLDQAGLDILSMARMIFLMTSSDPRSMPSDSSVSVVVQWLREFLQDPVVSTFHNLHQQSQGCNYS